MSRDGYTCYFQHVIHDSLATSLTSLLSVLTDVTCRLLVKRLVICITRNYIRKTVTTKLTSLHQRFNEKDNASVCTFNISTFCSAMLSRCLEVPNTLQTVLLPHM